MTWLSGRSFPGVVLACVVQLPAFAYQQYINVPGPAVPAQGTNAVVVQVETPARGPDGKFSLRHFAPDRNDVQFRDVDIRVDAGARTSSHSNTVAQLFFGSRRSIAKGIDTAYVFDAGGWLGRLSRWDLDPDHVSALFPGPIVNHSHVAKPPIAAKLLRRADYSALSNNVLHVAGVRRTGPGEPIMAGGYNSLVVGGAVLNIATPYPVLDDFYGQARTRPHLVGPFPHASATAPIVAAAAVRLNALAAQQRLTFPSMSRHGSEQLPVELVKAILMAGASADFEYTNKGEVLVNAFGTLGITDNGLDVRYGMGMLNVAAAEHILRAHRGPARSATACSPASADAGSGVTIGAQQSSVVMSASCAATDSGYAYEAGLSGADGASAAFSVNPPSDGKLTASLVWLADIRRDGAGLTGRVHDYDLELVDMTDRTTSVAKSAAEFDTTENLRASVRQGRSYRLVVTRKGSTSAPWPFALAWHLSR